MLFSVGLSAVEAHENLFYYVELHKINLLGLGISVSLSILSRFSILKYEFIAEQNPRSKIKLKFIIFIRFFLFRLFLYGYALESMLDRALYSVNI